MTLKYNVVAAKQNSQLNINFNTVANVTIHTYVNYKSI